MQLGLHKPFESSYWVLRYTKQVDQAITAIAEAG